MTDGNDFQFHFFFLINERDDAAGVAVAAHHPQSRSSSRLSSVHPSRVTPEAPPRPHYLRKLLNLGTMGAVGAGRGLWGHGQGRSPLPCKQFRPPDPRGQERTPPAPWAPLRSGPRGGRGWAGSGGGASAVIPLPPSFLLLTAIIPGLRSSLTGIPQPSLPPSLLFCVHRDYPPASETNSWSSPCLTLFTRGRLPDSVPPSAHLPASSSLRFCFRSPLPSLCLVICTDGHAPASCCSLLGIPIPLPRDVTLGTVKLRQGDNRE